MGTGEKKETRLYNGSGDGGNCGTMEAKGTFMGISCGKGQKNGHYYFNARRKMSYIYFCGIYTSSVNYLYCVGRKSLRNVGQLSMGSGVTRSRNDS